MHRGGLLLDVEIGHSRPQAVEQRLEPAVGRAVAAERRGAADAQGPLTAVATRNSWFSAGGSCSVQSGGMNGVQSLVLEGKGSTAINRGLVVAQN